MLTIIKGNILDDDADALVNPVNCVGVMGKGLALEFKKRFPENFKSYQEECQAGYMRPGKIFVYLHKDGDRKRFIMNFPTKNHWKDPSKLDWIGLGLYHLWSLVYRYPIGSIAFPMLGCGLGGLDPYYVKILIADFASCLPDMDVRLYE